MTATQAGSSSTSPEPAEGGTLSFDVPEVPRVIWYLDQYTEERHVIKDVAADSWDVLVNGTRQRLHFSRYLVDSRLNRLIKGWCAEMFSGLAPATALAYFGALSSVPLTIVCELLNAAPSEARRYWERHVVDASSQLSCAAMKSMLRFMCALGLGHWRQQYAELLSSAFPLPVRDRYAAVKRGEVFLDSSEEATLVRWIDEQIARVGQLSPDSLAALCMLICSYQFGMRPLQIALLHIADVRPRTAHGDNGQLVHIRFQMAKQLGGHSRRLPLHRSVKREWTSAFVLLHSQRASQSDAHDHFFNFRSVREVTYALNDTVQSVLAVERTSTDLRHTAAQRMVDAGASIEEVAEFLGQSELTTCLIYFDTSANQAELLNKALGLSPIYRRVAQLAHARFISTEELRSLKSSQQIAGVPHGIPIAGIGGCESGQPACPLNPILSCYGCKKFMPVKERPIHDQVLSDFRGIVHEFNDVSRGDVSSPTFLQLRRAITEVQGVIAELTPQGEGT